MLVDVALFPGSTPLIQCKKGWGVEPAIQKNSRNCIILLILIASPMWINIQYFLTSENCIMCAMLHKYLLNELFLSNKYITEQKEGSAGITD